MKKYWNNKALRNAGLVLLASIVTCFLIGPNVALLVAPILIYFLIRFLIDILKMIRSRSFSRIILLRFLNLILVVGVFGAGNRIYRHFGVQAFRITVEAVKKYHTENTRYPPSLESLVPKYLEQIPRPYYCLFGPKFYYNSTLNIGKEPNLSLAIVSPFFRVSYLFQESREIYLD